MNERPADRISFGAAQSAVIDGVGVLPSETVPLREALGRVIRQDVVCDTDCPSVDVSAVDGYGFASQSAAGASLAVPVTLRIVGTVKAGAIPVMSLGEGECVAIMTGGPLPAGSDTVVAAEDVQARGDLVVVTSPAPSGACVTKRGDFARTGETLGLAGRRATAQVSAALAGFGAPMVSVSRRPRLGILATGDELVGCEAIPELGRVRASNLPMLAALASDIGCDVVDIAIGRDREDELARQIERWDAFDAIIISGGVSTGKFDLVPGALRAVGAEIVFSDIRMRPGGRTIFARKRDSAFFCLPGSPIGAMVAFLMIARPGLLAMMGSSAAVPTPFSLRTTARLDKGWTLTAGCAYGGGEVGANAETNGRTTGLRGRAARTWFVPARCVQSNRDKGLWVEPLAGHGVGGARVLARATCLIRIDEKTQSVEPSQMVDVFMVQTDGSFTGAAGI